MRKTRSPESNTHALLNQLAIHNDAMLAICDRFVDIGTPMPLLERRVRDLKRLIDTGIDLYLETLEQLHFEEKYLAEPRPERTDAHPSI